MFVGKIIWGYSSKVEQMTVNHQVWVRFPLSPQNIGLWCNGSTADLIKKSIGVTIVTLGFDPKRGSLTLPYSTKILIYEIRLVKRKN